MENKSLGEYSLEELRKRWDEADDNSGQAGGHAQGEIFAEIEKRTSENISGIEAGYIKVKESTPVIKTSRRSEVKPGIYTSSVDNLLSARGYKGYSGRRGSRH